MKEESIQVKFTNSHNPRAKFDLLKIEEILSRQDLDHDPCQLHLLDFYLILFIQKGKGKHTIDFIDYSCNPGTILTIRKDQLHKFFKNNLQGYVLIFKDEFLEHYLEKLEAMKALQLFNEQLGAPLLQLNPPEIEEVNGLLKRMESEYFTLNDQYSLEIIRSELHILITKLYRIKAGKAPTFNNKRYLPEFVTFQNLIEQKVHQTTKVKDYAQMMGLSTKTLNKVSQEMLNKTAKQFIDEIGIKRIKRLLVNTNHSIKEIAFISGFEETTNFYKYFKRHTNTTPEQFRHSN